MNGKRGKGSRRKGEEEEDEEEEEERGGGEREGCGVVCGGRDSGGNALPLSSLLPPLSIIVPPAPAFDLAAYIESRAPSENRWEEKREEVEPGLPAAPCWGDGGG